MPKSRKTSITAAVVIIAIVGPFFGCRNLQARSRYFSATDPGSRYNFKFVKERESGRWVQRQVEVRVSVKRKLPDPLTGEDGDRLHSQLFTPETAQTGDLSPGKFIVRDGFRVWRFTSNMDDVDLRGRRAIGIQIEWPKREGPSDWEPMEIFPYPPPGDLSPDTWTDWMRAPEQRGSGFAWLNEVTDQPQEAHAPVEYPFEIRWRFILVEIPGRVVDEPWGE